MRIDNRINIVNKLISPFKMQFDETLSSCKNENPEFWDMIYADDTEHLVGIVFIILQNYINSSINDLYPDVLKLHTYYSFDKKINDSQTSRIELITSIANFYKHRDLPADLRQSTLKHFDNLAIPYKVFYNTETSEYFHKIGSASPVFEGLCLLTETWNLNELIEIVSEWREILWLDEEKKSTI